MHIVTNIDHSRLHPEKFRTYTWHWTQEDFKSPDELFDVEYTDGTTLLAECMDRILKLSELLAEKSQNVD